MPAKGKHRRPKSQRFTRGFAVAGTGSAALALPLLGAAGAHAATPASAPAAAQEMAGQKSVERVVSAAPEGAQKSARKAPTTYAVVSGDSLSAIAHQLDVDGGWKRLYQDNREVVGGDPAFILPGMKLSVGAAKTSGEAAEAAKPAKPAKPAETEPAEAAAPAKPAAQEQAEPAAAAGGFTRPVEGAVSTSYRTAGGMWSSGYHTGTDFAVPSGTPIKAVGDGTVVSAGWGGSYGNEVVIRHADGHYSQYAHMTSLNVSTGQTVSGGQQIGLSGSTGNSTGPHLHFEIRTGSGYGSDVDPLAYLRSHGVSI